MENDQNIIHPLDIGGVRLENNLILAPMAGVSDPPFRLLCREQGAGLVCMEMVSAKALHYHNKKTFGLLRVEDGERPVSLQLFGSDPDCMAEATRMIDDEPFDILDINMGCPVQKIVKSGDGSALMKNLPLAEKVIKACVNATKKPVTVKIRAGFDPAHVNAVEMAKMAEAAGAAAIAVHGRTREQMYAGKADWDIIRRVKEALAIPVIGNGDLDGAAAVREMHVKTGCDGFMVARSAQGNPWIFSRILRELLGGEKIPPPTKSEARRMIERHATMQVAAKGEALGMKQMRKHASWYVGGYPGAARLREAINNMETLSELIELLDRWENSNK